MVDSFSDSMDMNWSKLKEIVKIEVGHYKDDLDKQF